MRVFVPAETRPGERRVAMLPDVVGRLTKLQLEVAVESGAGESAFASDDDYRAAGAEVVAAGEVAARVAAADLTASVRPLPTELASQVKAGAIDKRLRCHLISSPGFRERSPWTP